MRSRRTGHVAIFLGIGLLAQIGQVQSEQAPAAPVSIGVVQSELTLASRTVRVSFAPALRADDPAHRTVLSPASNVAGGRVRVAELESNAAIHLSGVELAANSSSPLRYDVWLERSGGAWQLGVAESEGRAAPEPTTAQRAVPLVHTVRTGTSPTFTAALVATDKDTGRLQLQWGLDQWTVDVRFGDAAQPAAPRAPGTGDSRTREDDTSGISRAKTLEERNETALVLPDGSRLSVLFWKDLDTGAQDFRQIAAATDGMVIRLTNGAVTRLKTDVPLRLGVPTVCGSSGRGADGGSCSPMSRTSGGPSTIPLSMQRRSSWPIHKTMRPPDRSGLP
jgi:hypothetical protein